MKRENKYLKIKACAKVNAGYPLRGAASKLDKGELGLIRLQNVSGGTHIRFDEVDVFAYLNLRKLNSCQRET